MRRSGKIVCEKLGKSGKRAIGVMTRRIETKCLCILVRSDGISQNGQIRSWTGRVIDTWSSRADFTEGFYYTYELFFDDQTVLVSNANSTSRWFAFPLRCLVR